MTIEHETYETIRGKWWLFEYGKAIRLLTDEEAANVIWGAEEMQDGDKDAAAVVMETVEDMA